MIKYFKKLINLVFLNIYEKNFIKNYEDLKLENAKKIKKINKKIILFQSPMDYYFVLISRAIISEKYLHKIDLFGTWPYYFNPLRIRRFNIFTIFHYFKNKILFFLLFRKWRKIYKKNHINYIYNFSSLKLKSLIFFLKKYKKIIQKLNTKHDVLKIRINNIYVGDLIYDTYIRYRAVPFLNLNDLYLKYIIFKTLIIYWNIVEFTKKNKIEGYFTSYSSYINHGLIVRIFLSKNIKVFSLPRNYGNNYVNLLTKKFPYAKKNYSNLLIKFKKENQKNKKIEKAKFLLKNRFSNTGDDLTKYLKYKPIYKFKNDINFNYEGVIFLHDFYDAPHEMGLRLFTDFYDWFEFLNFIIKKNNLNFAFKFHPNFKPESLKFNNYLKNKYDTNFLDIKLSNLSIFKSKTFKVGISVCGSVLYELLYFNKIPLYLADNLISPLNIHALPNNKNEYEKLILNYKKIKIDKKIKKRMLSIYYMALQDQSYFDCTIAKKVKLKESNFLNPVDFNKYLKKIEPEIKKLSF